MLGHERYGRPSQSRLSVPILSPLSGQVLPAKDIEQPLIQSGMLGHGCAIKPTSDHLLAPFDAKLTHLSNGYEQLRLKSRQGLELIVHVGLYAHHWHRCGFVPKIKVGDTIKQGAHLMDFQLHQLRDKAQWPYCFILCPQWPKLSGIEVFSGQAFAGRDHCMNLHLP